MLSPDDIMISSFFEIVLFKLVFQLSNVVQTYTWGSLLFIMMILQSRTQSMRTRLDDIIVFIYSDQGTPNHHLRLKSTVVLYIIISIQYTQHVTFHRAIV